MVGNKVFAGVADGSIIIFKPNEGKGWGRGRGRKRGGGWGELHVTLEQQCAFFPALFVGKRPRISRCCNWQPEVIGRCYPGGRGGLLFEPFLLRTSFLFLLFICFYVCFLFVSSAFFARLFVSFPSSPGFRRSLICLLSSLFVLFVLFARSADLVWNFGEPKAMSLGRHPVMAITLVDQCLWCASGNTIFIVDPNEEAIKVTPRSISNFSCSLTSNITSHSMKNLAFHSLLR